MSKLRTHHGRIVIPMAALVVSLAPTRGFAKEPITTQEAPSIWDISLEAGVNLTDGNSDTLGVHAGFTAERITDADEIRLGTIFRYAEDSSVTTDESVYSYAQYNKMLSDRAYLGLVGDFLYDDIAAVDYQLNVGPTLGYYLIKNDRTTLALEAGAGYQWDKVGGHKSDYFTLRFAQRLTHQLTDNLSLFQSAAFIPEAEDFDNYRLDVRAGIESRVSDRMSLQIFASNRYDSTPAAGLDENDFGVFSGLSYSLGAVDPLPAAGGGGAKDASGSDCCDSSDWDADLGVGFFLTDGNSDTLGVTADLSATRLTDTRETFLGAGMAYGETGSVRNQERAYAFGQHNYFLAERCYAAGRIDFLYDAITDLDYRVTPSLLLGHYLIKSDTTRLAIEAGPSYTWEKQGGIKNDYFGVFFGERFSHQINDRLDLWQTLGLVLDVDNTDNVVVNAAAGLDLKVSEHLSVRTSVQNIYDNEPAAGVEKNDFRLTSGLVWSF